MTEASQDNPSHVEEQKVSFEESYLQEPTAKALWAQLEPWGLALGVLSILISLLWGSLSVSLGWAIGFSGGFLNVVGMKRLLHWLISSGAGSGLVTAALVFKMTLLMVGSWAALRYLPASPPAFAAGYGLAMAGLVVGSVILALRVKASPQPEDGVEGDRREDTRR